jgi:hypothetical protein
MRVIKDPSFVRTVYRRFCLRPVSDRASRAAIQTRRVEVHPQEGGTLVISICDREGSLVDIGWDGETAWGMRASQADAALLEADETDLSRCVGRFLRTHGVVDHRGMVQWAPEVVSRFRLTVITTLETYEPPGIPAEVLARLAIPQVIDAVLTRIDAVPYRGNDHAYITEAASVLTVALQETVRHRLAAMKAFETFPPPTIQ